MRKSLLKGSLVLVAALLLAGTFLWADLRFERPVTPVRVTAAPAVEDTDEAVFWDEDDIAFNEEDGGGVPRPVRIVARILGLSDGQIEELLADISEVKAINEQRRANNEAIREQFESGSPDAGEIGALVILNHDLALEIGGIRREFVESLDDDQKRRLGAVRRASRLQWVLPAFRGLGLVR